MAVRKKASGKKQVSGKAQLSAQKKTSGKGQLPTKAKRSGKIEAQEKASALYPDVQAVILAAGRSTRTYPLTISRPKVLLPVLNKTLLEHNLDQLVGLVGEVIIVVGFAKEMIMQKLGSSYRGLSISYVVQDEQKGTGDALRCAQSLITGRFLFLYGDDLYSRKDLERLFLHEYCVLAHKVKNPDRFGIFETKGAKVLRIIEKPKKALSDLANIGGWLIDRKIFGFSLKRTERGELEATDYLSLLASQHDVSFEIVQDYWLPIGYPWSLLDASEFLIRRISPDIRGEASERADIRGTLVLGEGSVIKPGVLVEGNVVIGRNCEIGPNAYLRNGTVLGDNCKVGQAVELKNTIVMDNSKIPHLSYIGDSVIGSGVNLGAGTITGNLRHDNGNVCTMIAGVLTDSGRRKLGAIIGDDVHTGIHTSIYPGRKLWPGTCTRPGQVVDKDIGGE